MRTFRVPRLAAVSLALTAALGSAPLLMAADQAKATDQDKAEMSATALQVGQKAPAFSLTDTQGKTHTLADYAGKTVVLEWFNPDCPFVKKHHQLHDSMHKTYAAAKEMGVVWLAINSGAPGKQGAGLERNVAAVSEYEIAYPVLLDEEGKVGRMYGALTTPHMFVISAEGMLLYQGAIDDNNNPKDLGELNYVSAALKAIQSGKPVETASTKSYGCNVKYAS
jgi:peroxiredoxin